MGESGLTQIETIQRDLACPTCEYNLRGLRGAVVECPECGTRCDVAELIARKWTGPWYRAPGLMMLELPAVVVSVGLSFVVFMPGMAEPAPAAVGIVIVLVLWGWMAYLDVRRFGLWTGLGMIAVAHGVTFAYVVGVLGGLISVIFLVVDAVDRGFVRPSAVVIVVGCILLYALGHVSERGLARACIRHELNRSARPRE